MASFRRRGVVVAAPDRRRPGAGCRLPAAAAANARGAVSRKGDRERRGVLMVFRVVVVVLFDGASETR
jgi:hypothetical protein